MGGKPNRAWKYLCLCLTGLISFSSFNCAILEDLRRQSAVGEYLETGKKRLTEGRHEDALHEFQKVLSLSPRRPPADEALYYMGTIYVHSDYSKKDYKKSIQFFTTLLKDHAQSPLAGQTRIWLGVLSENEKALQTIDRMKESLREQEKGRQALAPREPEKPKPSEGSPQERRPEDRADNREQIVRTQKLLAQREFGTLISENEKILSSPTPRTPKEDALYTMGLLYVHFGNPKKDVAKSLEYFKRLVKEHPSSFLADQAKVWIEVLQENEDLNQVILKLKQIDIEIEERKRQKAK